MGDKNIDHIIQYDGIDKICCEVKKDITPIEVMFAQLIFTAKKATKYLFSPE